MNPASRDWRDGRSVVVMRNGRVCGDGLGGAIEGLLGAEVIVDQCLVDACLVRDLMRPRVRAPLAHEHPVRCGKNAFARGTVVARRAATPHPTGRRGL